MAICLLWLLYLILNYGQSHKYIGCYQDKSSSENRDLAGSLFLDKSMHPDKCEALCAEAEFLYFGLQYGDECWCGNRFGSNGNVDESKCNKQCGGKDDVKCGGSLVNSIYKITKVVSKKKNSNEQPLLALVMIVKNEAHTLPNTLVTLKPIIDAYYILDTGSTDGTPDVIRKTLDGIPGEIAHGPFIDYGNARNRALDLAQNAKKTPIFSLMLSADETLYNSKDLRKFCSEHRNNNGPTHEAYHIRMDVGWKFDSTRLSRTNKGWRYKGRVHEYLASPRGTRVTYRVPGAWVKFRATDSGRRNKQEETILRILLEEKEKNPSDTRTSFYLARTYNVLGNHSAALQEFYRRIALKGWWEEVYESKYAVAWQKKSLGYSWPEVQQAFLDAHAFSPNRAEPLFNIAKHWYLKKRWALVYLFAFRASQFVYPKKCVLWVQKDVYDWKSNRLVAISAIKLAEKDGSGKEYYKIGAKACLKALRNYDSIELHKLKERYRHKLLDHEWEEVQSLNKLGNKKKSKLKKKSTKFNKLFEQINKNKNNRSFSKDLDKKQLIEIKTQFTSDEDNSWFNQLAIIVCIGMFIMVCLMIACVIQPLLGTSFSSIINSEVNKYP